MNGSPPAADQLAAEALDAIARHDDVLALAKLDQLASVAPEHELLAKCRAFTLMRQGQSRDALTEARKAVALDPKDLIAWRILGQTAWRQNVFGLALQAFERVVALSNRAPEDLGMYAVLLAEERSAKLAERMALEALRTDAKCATALAALGLAQFRQHRYAEAQQSLQRGLASHPNHDLLRAYMTHVLRVTHQHSKAQALTSLMTDDPKTASLAEELQKDDRLRDAARRLYERKEFQDEVFEYKRNNGWRPLLRVAGWTLLIALLVMVPFVILPPRDPTQFGIRVFILALVVVGAWAKQRL